VSLTDEDVPAWWRRLGLPGLFDVHVHFLPPPVMAKVRRQFDTAGPLIGRAWPLQYRGDDFERVAHLRALGVRRFPSLPYAHRPGIAGYLNEWAAGLAAEVPECLSSATFFPEEGVGEYVGALVDAGTEMFKVHVQVGDFDLNDPLLDDAWGRLAEAGTPVVVHASGGPVGNDHTGPGPMRKLMERHPRLTAVIAHMGAPEYTGFVEIATRNWSDRLIVRNHPDRARRTCRRSTRRRVRCPRQARFPRAHNREVSTAQPAGHAARPAAGMGRAPWLRS